MKISGDPIAILKVIHQVTHTPISKNSWKHHPSPRHPSTPSQGPSLWGSPWARLHLQTPTLSLPSTDPSAGKVRTTLTGYLGWC